MEKGIRRPEDQRGAPMFIDRVCGHIHEGDDLYIVICVDTTCAFPDGHSVELAVEMAIGPEQLAGMVSNAIHCGSNPEYVRQYKEALALCKIEAKRDTN